MCFLKIPTLRQALPVFYGFLFDHVIWTLLSNAWKLSIDRFPCMPDVMSFYANLMIHLVVGLDASVIIHSLILPLWIILLLFGLLISSLSHSSVTFRDTRCFAGCFRLFRFHQGPVSFAQYMHVLLPVGFDL